MDGVSGVAGAAPIWRDVIEAAAVAGGVWPAPPPGLARDRVCSPTGLRPGPDCPAVVAEWFLEGTRPSATESYYVRGASGRLEIAPPPEARAWATEAGLTLTRGDGTAGPTAFVVRPVDGAVLFLSPEVASQRLLIRATAAGAVAIQLRVDGHPAGESPGTDITLAWPLGLGKHVIQVEARLADGSTTTATSRYEVR